MSARADGAGAASAGSFVSASFQVSATWRAECTVGPVSSIMLDRQQTALKAPLAAPATGRSFPIGATLADGGANFSLFSRGAAAIELLLFDRSDDARPSRVIPIDPCLNRTYHYWHVFVRSEEHTSELQSLRH